MAFQKGTTEYEALTPLSVGRGPSDKDKAADIIQPHETVWLTEEQAHGFLTRHRIPVIRPVAEQNDPASRITARDLFGRQPGAQQFGARPDPAGASKVVINEDVPEQGADPEHARKAPEANDPQVEPDIDPAVVKDKGRR